jgi:hypothetical protein
MLAGICLFEKGLVILRYPLEVQVSEVIDPKQYSQDRKEILACKSKVDALIRPLRRCNFSGDIHRESYPLVL